MAQRNSFSKLTEAIKGLKKQVVRIGSEESEVGKCFSRVEQAVADVATDVTEMKQAEDKLRESEERFQAVFETSMDAIFFTAPDGRVFSANPAACKMFGYKEKELIELGREAVVDMSDPRLADAIEERRAKGSFKGELNFKHKDGSTIPIELTSVIFNTRNGQEMSSIIVREIIERKQAEAMLRRSEQELRLISDNVSGQVCYVDKDGYYRFVNRRYQELYGIPQSEIIGKHYRELLGEAASEQISGYVKRVLSGERVSFEEDLPYANGGRRWVRADYVPDADSKGNVKGFFGLITDITEQKNAEEALRESEERFSIVFQSSPASIAIARDKDGKLIDVNPAWEKMTGVTREEALGRTSIELDLWVNPSDRERLLSKLRQGGAARDLEFQFRRKSGSVSDMLLSAELIELAGESYLLTLAQDITSRKQLEKQVLATQKMNTIAQLAGGVAHEVRNPLNAILAITEALSLDLEEGSEHKIYLDHIRSQVDRLTVLMRDLLDLGKPVEPSNLKRETPSEICRAAIDQWKRYSSYKKHQAFIVCPLEVSNITLLADSTRLEQVFFNVLENAAQHSPEESEIEFSIFKMDASSLGIRITDRGKGISQENLSHVFDPFFTTRRDGVGLGLSVVKQIIEWHGGNIRIYNNDPPPGCTVEISLPIAPED